MTPPPVLRQRQNRMHGVPAAKSSPSQSHSRKTVPSATSPRAVKAVPPAPLKQQAASRARGLPAMRTLDSPRSFPRGSPQGQQSPVEATTSKRSSEAVATCAAKQESAEQTSSAPVMGTAAAAAAAIVAAIVTNSPRTQERLVTKSPRTQQRLVMKSPRTQERLATIPEAPYGAEDDAEPEPEEPGHDADTPRSEPAEDSEQVACKAVHRPCQRSVSEGSLRTLPSRASEGSTTSRRHSCGTLPQPPTGVPANSGAEAARVRHALCVNHLHGLADLVRELEDENLSLRGREEKLRVTNARISQRLRLLEGDPNLLRRLYRGAGLPCKEDIATSMKATLRSGHGAARAV